MHSSVTKIVQDGRRIGSNRRAKKEERKDRTCGIHVVLDLVHQIRIDRVDASHQMRRLDERRSRVVPVRLGGQGGRRWFGAFDDSEGRHWEVEDQFFYDRGSG